MCTPSGARLLSASLLSAALLALSLLVVGLALVGSGTSVASAQHREMIPRIMYWYGKVNQHIDLRTGAWMTDPDGRSGANIDMLEYCRRWYPATARVEPYQEEQIDTWRERGNVGAHTATRMSYRCVQREDKSAGR